MQMGESVVCVDSVGSGRRGRVALTKGKLYLVIDDKGPDIVVENDRRTLTNYSKRRFKYPSELEAPKLFIVLSLFDGAAVCSGVFSSKNKAQVRSESLIGARVDQVDFDPLP